MPVAGITIEGLDPIITRSKAFQKQLNSELRKAQATIRKSLVSQLSAYPAPPPNSKYTRTFALQRGWERAVPILEKDGAVMRLINSVTYEPLVQDNASQAQVHQDRWQTTQEIAEDNEEATRQAFEDAAARACQWVEKG